jgi:hypothetical protein
MPQFDDPEDAASRLSNLETQSSAQRGSAALTCGKPPAFRKPRSSLPPPRSLSACPGEALQERGPGGEAEPSRTTVGGAAGRPRLDRGQFGQA